MRETYRVADRCRVCGSAHLWQFLSLGDSPLANAFVRPGTPTPDPRYPLALVKCEDCTQVQLTVVVRPEILFRDYAYASSASSSMIEHFRAMAGAITSRYATRGTLVVEIGSNDGVLLRPLAAAGARVLGVEPAENLAAVANAAGVETWNAFFSLSLARRIVVEKGQARVVVANNVMAHIDDLDDLTQGLNALLDGDGVFVAEVPYLVELLDRVEFDTVYHEHLSYFSISALRTLFARRGLELFDVKRETVHGGSLRLHVGRPGRHPLTAGLTATLEDESRREMHDRVPYQEFARRVVVARDALRSLVHTLRTQGKRIAGYGAAAKGNTLLNYCGLASDDIEFIVDSTPYKQGLLAPGTRIPVVPESWILDRQPDYALLLAWNHAEAIVRKNAEYVRRGGRFILPLPVARVMD